MLAIDLSFIQSGAGAYLRQFSLLQHIDSAIAPSTHVKVIESRGNRTHRSGKEDEEELQFEQSSPLIQLITMENIETYLILRKVLRHLYDNVFARAQVIMLAYTLMVILLVLLLVFGFFQDQTRRKLNLKKSFLHLMQKTNRYPYQ